MLESGYSSISVHRRGKIHDDLAGGHGPRIQNRMIPTDSIPSGSMQYPCPVCGYLVFDEPPGSFAICPICFWEDDIVQLGFPLMAGGANRVSLHQAQQNFMQGGVCEARLKRHVRQAESYDKRDPEWRPFEPTNDPHLRWDLPEDSDRWQAIGGEPCLYYWRPEYWLRPKRTRTG